MSNHTTPTIDPSGSASATPAGRHRTRRSAAVAATIAVGVALMGCDNRTEPEAGASELATAPPATTASPSQIELRGAEDNLEAAEAFRAVEAMYEALNYGPVETWAPTYTDVPQAVDPDAYGNEIGYFHAARAADARFDVEYCDYVGLIERDVAPDEVDEPNLVTGHGFHCVETMTDAFTEAAGIDFVQEPTWLVADEGLFTPDVGGFGARFQLREFLTDFWGWVAREHPDFEVSPYRFYLYPEAEDVPRAVELLDEFVEADDRWPVADRAVAATTVAPSTSPIELRGADGDAEALEAFAAISAAFEAFNTGDAVGWSTARGAPSLEPGEEDLAFAAAAHEAGARYDVAHCSYDGFGDHKPWGGDASVSVLTGHRFVCLATMTDAFTEAAGIEFEEEFEWLVADGTVVDAVSSYGSLKVLQRFMGNFMAWLGTEHPETYDSMTTIRFYNYPIAADIPIALELLDEFVDADERWPVSTEPPSPQPVGSGPLQADASGAAPSGGTPLPDVDGAVLGDDGSVPLPLGVVDTVPGSERLDFLFEFCGWHGPGCFRDAHLMNPDDPIMGSGIFTAGRAFHIRHGFVNDGPEPLGPGFDLVVYVTPLDLPGEHGGHTLGATVRYTSDYVVRGTADRCGPQYRTQAEPVTCEWFVHEFPDGLPEGRHAIWTMWEAPCQDWLRWGFNGSCDEPDATLSMFTSGYDGPYGSAPPQFTERNEVGRNPDDAAAT